MSIYDNVLDMATKEQSIAGQQTMNAFRVAEMATTLRSWQQQDASRQAMIALDATRTQDAARSDTSAPPVAQDPLMSNPALASINQAYTQAQLDYQYHTRAAAAIRANGGDLKLAEKYDDNAKDARTNMIAAQTRLLAQRKETLSEIGGVAQSAYADNFPQVRAQLDRLNPGWSQGQDYDVSPLTGQITWGPRTRTLLDTVARSSLATKDQVELDLRNGTLERQLDRDATLADHEAEQEDHWRAGDRYKRERLGQMDRDLNRKDLALKDRENGVGVNPRVAPQPRVTETEVKDSVPSVQTELQLPPPDAKVATRDFLRKRNELMAKDPNLDQDMAETQAMDWVKSRVQPATEGKKAPWYIPFTKWETPPTPAKYVRGGPQSSDDEQAATVIAPLTKAGLDIKMTDGVVTAKDGTPVKVSTPEQARLLPKGTRFVDPDGVARLVP